MPFYKAIAAGNKVRIVAAERNGPVDGRKGLGPEPKQIVDVDANTLA